ncbi:MAG: hypothetical protein GX856_00525 [Gammaproteobacteria bacterium]|nr:hypothetical protein [Gammaproteobacteria bacterium]
MSTQQVERMLAAAVAESVYYMSGKLAAPRHGATVAGVASWLALAVIVAGLLAMAARA